MKGRYILRDRETGTEIERCDTLGMAIYILNEYEEIDKADETYTEDFYEIYDSEKDEVI